jgi:membrane-associated phospholipid phosphatase
MFNRVAKRIFQLWTRLGLLVPVSILALLMGTLVQHAWSEVPSSYTWTRPYLVLRDTFATRYVPTALLLAWCLGVCARQRWHLIGGAAAGGVTHAESLLGKGRILRAVGALAALGLDVAFFPGHSSSDGIALMLFGFLVARPYSRADLLSTLVSACSTLLVFTAVCYWFTVTKALTFIGQTPLDARLAAIEQFLCGVQPYRLVAAWAAGHPRIVHWFDWAYFKIFDHMALTAAFLFGLKNIRVRNEYLAALAICYLLGGPLYLLFPSQGPVYFDPGRFLFLKNQSLIVNYMQQHLFDNTMAVGVGQAHRLETWSYIACMPSLHMAHEVVMLYYVRASHLAFFLSLLFSAFTSVAVVALGWHYPTDVLAGFALAAIAIALARWQSDRLFPRAASV